MCSHGGLYHHLRYVIGQKNGDASIPSTLLRKLCALSQAASSRVSCSMACNTYLDSLFLHYLPSVLAHDVLLDHSQQKSSSLCMSTL